MKCSRFIKWIWMFVVIFLIGLFGIICMVVWVLLVRWFNDIFCFLSLMWICWCCVFCIYWFDFLMFVRVLLVVSWLLFILVLNFFILVLNILFGSVLKMMLVWMFFFILVSDFFWKFVIIFSVLLIIEVRGVFCLV